MKYSFKKLEFEYSIYDEGYEIARCPTELTARTITDALNAKCGTVMLLTNDAAIDSTSGSYDT